MAKSPIQEKFVELIISYEVEPTYLVDILEAYKLYLQSLYTMNPDLANQSIQLLEDLKDDDCIELIELIRDHLEG